MNKKKLILSAAMIVLLPLLSALINTGYVLAVRAITPTPDIVAQGVGRIIFFGIPAALIIYYGYRTGDKITSTLSGVFFFPLFNFYSGIPFRSLIPFLRYWLSWKGFLDLAPPVLIFGLLGYFASRRTKASLVVAIALGIFIILMFLGID